MELPKLFRPKPEYKSEPKPEYSELQLFFLLRLNDIYSRSINPEIISGFTEAERNFKIRLLKTAVYSTYLDCVELGVGEDARTLFHKTPLA